MKGEVKEVCGQGHDGGVEGDSRILDMTSNLSSFEFRYSDQDS